MERNLPEPEQYKNPNRGSESPIKVVQEIYTAGDARRGVQTSAFNLPNDEVVREKKGSKKVLLKNVMDAKFRQSGKPIALRVLDPSLTSLALVRRLLQPHPLPRAVARPRAGLSSTQPDGKRVDSRIPLKKLYSTIEECKADVLGLWNILYAQEHKLLDGVRRAAALRDVRRPDVPLDALRHRRGARPRHGDAVELAAREGRDRPERGRHVHGRLREVRARQSASLATELLTIEATGDYDRANALLEKYGVETAEMKSVNAKLKDIPVDITPVFAAAGEK